MSFLPHEVRPQSIGLSPIIYGKDHCGLSPTGVKIAAKPEPKPVANEVQEEKDSVDQK